METFGTKFDVVLVDPPWEEYARRATGSTEITVWPWQDVQALDVGAIADNPAFVFLWCETPQLPSVSDCTFMHSDWPHDVFDDRPLYIAAN